MSVNHYLYKLGDHFLCECPTYFDAGVSLVSNDKAAYIPSILFV